MKTIRMVVLTCLCNSAFAATPEAMLRIAKTGVVELPAGTFEVTREITLPPDAHDLEIRAAKAGTILKAAATFRGRALLALPGGRNIRIVNVTLNGNRDALQTKPLGLPPSDVMFSRFTPDNGILAENITGLTITGVSAVDIGGFAVLVNASSKVKLEGVTVRDSGSLNLKKRNNTTGGILLEEGTSDFEVVKCKLINVRGNGIWTHSLYTSKRNSKGRIAGNDFVLTARDAIQVGHATQIIVEDNHAREIGYPANEIDLEGAAFPVGIDTAGNVDQSIYRNNIFDEIDGKCIDLDGFHDGEVSGNTCRNLEDVKSYPFGNFGIIMNNTNPDMQSRNIRIVNNIIDGTLFGGIFVIGSGHTVSGNKLTRINLAHCPDTKQFNCLYNPAQPALLRTGIYLGSSAERPAPAQGNTIEKNEIGGYGQSRGCIEFAPGVKKEANKIGKNDCSDEAQIAWLRH